ncbi:MAG: thermonuclease family protein [Candidatus Zapsychrus exili]|nr:thermonuclease family protein [Candidatus Zapsychrus exili]
MSNTKTQKIIIILIIFLFCAINIYAQTNFEFFLNSGANKYKNAKIIRIVNTSTIIIEAEEIQEETIKLIGLKGVDAPNTHKNKKRDKYGFVIEERASPENTIEEKSNEFARELLQEKKIRLEFDIESRDSQGQVLAYVFLKEDGTFVNIELLKQGFANLQIRPPNLKYKDELRDAYKEARSEMRGIHNE